MANSKKSSIFRLSALLPLSIVVIITFFVFTIFLDPALKSALKWGLSKANGAYVEIVDLKTSFKNLSLDIKGIHFPDKDDLMMDKLIISHIHGSLSWDALLRAKLMSPLFKIEDIVLYQARKKKAQALAVKPKKESKLKKQVLGEIKESHKDQLIGSVASAGKSGNFQDIEIKNLKALETLEGKQREIQEQKKRIEELVANIEQTDEIKNIEEEIKNFPFDDLKNPKKLTATLKNLDKLKKKIDKSSKNYSELKKEVDKATRMISKIDLNVEDLIKEDINELKSQAKIPNLETDQLARMLFGPKFNEYLEMIDIYYKKVSDYLPAKKSEEYDTKKTTFSKPIRGQGRDYQFGTPKSYPLFWLKKISINTNKDESSYFKGEITNITTNQRVTQSSTRGDISFSDKIKKISGGKLLFELDHREKAIFNLNFNIDAIPAKRLSIINTKEATFSLDSSNLHNSANLSIVDGIFDFSFRNKYQDIVYGNKANSPIVLELFNGVSNVTPYLDLRAKATGRISNLKVEMSSNLADAFNKSLSLILSEKLKEFESKVRKDVLAKIEPIQKDINGQVSEVKAKANQTLSEIKKQFDGLNKKVKDEESKAKNSAQKNILKGIRL